MLKDKIFVHIDGDAFFVACEVARRPELAGLPVVVGEERGIVTALSYEAKAIGIKRGDPIFRIKKEYKNVTILQSHFDLYEKYSKMLHSILLEYTDEVEAYSVDECFMSFPASYFAQIDIREFFTNLKSRVKSETGITYSFGISYSKVSAKLASKHMKPNGLCILLDHDEILSIYKNKNVGEVWGIGHATKKRLESLGVISIYDFIGLEANYVDMRFNKGVMDLWNELRWENRLGIINENKDLKSLQATRSFTNITNDKSYVLGELSRNVEQAAGRLCALNLYTDEFIIFIKTHTKSLEHSKTFAIKITLKDYTRDVTVIMRQVCLGFDKIYDAKNKYKKTGVTMLNLKKKINIESSLLDLLDTGVSDKNRIYSDEEKTDKIKMHISKDLSSLMSEITNKIGSDKLYLATSHISRVRRSSDLIIRNQNDNYYYDLPLPYMGIAYCN